MTKTKKILLADDEANIRLLGEKLLKEAGYNVVLAEDGEDAIKKAIAERPDLVITDIRMPHKTGFDVCKALRADPVLNKTPILILSALGDEFNKLTGFEGGANDYIVKPFRAEELKDRVALLLEREIRIAGAAAPQKALSAEAALQKKLIQISTGSPNLDRVLSGGIPQGSNVLLIGSLGRGKSTFARKFIIEGIKNGEKCLFVAVDDDPVLVRNELNKHLTKKVEEHEKNNVLGFVDAYTWSSGEQRTGERYKIEDVLSLEQLSTLIGNAGGDIGQSVQKKQGGRRVIDSISSFFVNFELSNVQKFLTQIGRTAISFGGVTTLFVVEEGTVSDQALNNVKYLMDGVLEFKEDYTKRKVRAVNMKWIQFSKDWVEW